MTTLIVLDALEEGEWYAYGLRRAVHDRTHGLFTFSEGALYPLLHALRDQRLVSVERNAPTAENVQLLCARCRGRQSPN